MPSAIQQMDTLQLESEEDLSESSASVEESKLHTSGMDFDGEDSSKPGDGFVALNVEELIVNAADRWEPSSASPRSLVKEVKKNLSRNGSEAGGGGGRQSVALSSVGGPTGRDEHPRTVHVAIAAAGGRCRRAGGRLRPSRWCNPRRVLFVFASLSCMGTLILVYFTMAMGRMTTTASGDPN
ncbi:unnamed protein product [Musa banksii]